MKKFKSQVVETLLNEQQFSLAFKGRSAMNRAEELRSLAGMHVEIGDYDTALEYARRALMIEERAVGRNNLALAPFIHELAMIHAVLDHDGEARNLLGRLLRIIPTQHPLVKEIDLIVSELDRARSAA